MTHAVIAREPSGPQVLQSVKRPVPSPRAGEVLGLTLDFHQSNHEGVLVDWVQEARLNADAIVINAVALSGSSVPILDALMAFDDPIIEAHMSNIWKRERFRHHA